MGKASSYATVRELGDAYNEELNILQWRIHSVHLYHQASMEEIRRVVPPCNT